MQSCNIACHDGVKKIRIIAQASDHTDLSYAHGRAPNTPSKHKQPFQGPSMKSGVSRGHSDLRRAGGSLCLACCAHVCPKRSFQRENGPSIFLLHCNNTGRGPSPGVKLRNTAFVVSVVIRVINCLPFLNKRFLHT